MLTFCDLQVHMIRSILQLLSHHVLLVLQLECNGVSAVLR